MDTDRFNAFCESLPASTHVVQWGAHDVWKVGGKVYVIAGTQENGHFAASFKVSDMGWEVLRDHPDCRPAPYLASRGLKWIQYYRGDAMGDDELLDLIRDAHRIVASGLSKKKQRELGLLP